MPLVLILDGNLERMDGIVLILSFILYILWLFSEDERFKKVYDGTPPSSVSKDFKCFFKDIGIIVGGIALLLLAAQGIVNSASFFAQSFHIPLSLVGILIVGLSNCMPETYFSIISARKDQCWLILGDIMGSVIVPATLVLGIVALISPIKIVDFSPFAIARSFLIISAFVFLLFLRTGKCITKKEAGFLLGLYFIFVLAEIFFR